MLAGAVALSAAFSGGVYGGGEKGEKSYQMQPFGDIVLRGLKVERGGEMKRLRDLMGTVRDWELSSELVPEVMPPRDAKRLLQEIKGEAGVTIVPIYSPQTIYWIRFEYNDTRMVVEDTELKTLRVVRPQSGRRLPFQGFWVERREGNTEDSKAVD